MRLADSMAKLILPVGPQVGKRPDQVQRQSRVVALELQLAAGMGNTAFCYTPPLGNRTWLYSIDVWGYCSARGIAIGGFIYLTFGTGVPVGPGEAAVNWSSIIPLHCGVKSGFFWHSCEVFHRRFDMAMLFEHDELRFAVDIENFFPQAWNATVAFQFSEG